jgi:hypothetical protein
VTVDSELKTAELGPRFLEAAVLTLENHPHSVLPPPLKGLLVTSFRSCVRMATRRDGISIVATCGQDLQVASELSEKLGPGPGRAILARTDEEFEIIDESSSLAAHAREGGGAGRVDEAALMAERALVVHASGDQSPDCSRGLHACDECTTHATSAREITMPSAGERLRST